jgi:hypothetical protein
VRETDWVSCLMHIIVKKVSVWERERERERERDEHARG